MTWSSNYACPNGGSIRARRTPEGVEVTVERVVPLIVVLSEIQARMFGDALKALADVLPPMVSVLSDAERKELVFMLEQGVGLPNGERRKVLIARLEGKGP